MWEQMITDVEARNGLRRAGWEKVLDQLHLRLTSRGHPVVVIRNYMSAAMHFALWTLGKELQRSQVTDEHIASFLTRHLARCHCKIRRMRQHRLVHAALGHVKVVLDTGKHRPVEQHETPSAIDSEIHRFDEYMRTVAGLQETTRKSRRRYLFEFLRELYGSGKVEVSSITPARVVAYMSRRARGVKPASVKDVANALRCYFRFLQLHGKCDEGLILSVPSPVNPKSARVPQVLTDAEIQGIFATFDLKTDVGRRDYAITRCMFDLALRPREVSQLRLEDIDWREGTIRIVGNKCRRDDVLPLTATLGKALAVYLREVRGHSTGRHVFVHLRAPLGQPIIRQNISGIARRAAIRAGIKQKVGARTLRQTAATRMLRHGASLKEVADVLRHRDLNTATLYTKVDLPRLAAISTPWPKGDRQ